MTRCFVAVFPDEAVNRAVDATLELALRRDASGGRWRPVAAARRHVTLRFHAEADPEELADTLRPRLAGRPAPTLHCAGAGIFGTALWLGVVPDEQVRWSGLLAAVGTDPAGHVAHLTVARARGRPGAVPGGLEGRHGPSWTPGEVVLVASGVPHRVLERFPLVGGDEAVGPGR